MVATIQQLIGKINPKLYAENGDELLKKYKNIDDIPAEEVKQKSLATHVLIYDSASEQLEPLYFFIVKLMSDFGLNPQKYVDNFYASPGSGHFSEMGGKKSLMQQQGQKIVGDIYMILRGVLQLIYDLRDFKIRLKTYEDSHSKDKSVKEAASLTLKQLWLDKVDIMKGNSSVKAMALGQAGFQTLLDAFLIVSDESLKDASGKEIDLNDRVKRLLKARIQEFNIWFGSSENELSKRFKIQKNYLKSQVNTLKLYTRWARPYLKAAEELEGKDQGRSPDLVKSFNSIILELTLMGQGKMGIHDLVLEGKLPTEFDSMEKKGLLKRKYYSCVLVDFYFRGIPFKFSQRGDYTFGGKSQITFTAYSLNDDELKKLEELMSESDISESLKLIQGITDDNLKQIQEDIDEFIEDKETEEEAKKKKSAFSGENPFLALLGYYNEKPKKEEKKDKKEKVKIKPETWIEKEHLRKVSEAIAVGKAFDFFDIFKKSHGMVSFI